MDFLDELNRLAAALLEKAEALDASLQGSRDTADDAKRVQALLLDLCKALGDIVRILTSKDSPLEVVAGKARTVLYGNGFEKVEHFLDEHRTFLEAILGKKAKIVDQAIEALREAVGKNAEHDLEKAERMPLTTDIVGVLEAFRKLVCEIGNSPLLEKVLQVPQLLSAIVGGAIGAALVVVDVTAAAAALQSGEWTGLTLVKAVKSLWSGVKKLRKAISTIRELWDGIQERARSEADQKHLKNKSGTGPKLRKS